METSKDNKRWLSPAAVIVPFIYVGTVVLTCSLSARTPGGAYYRIWGIDPLAAMFGMVYDNVAVIVGVFLVSGTPWWYLVGRIGWGDRKRRLSAGVGGALFALFTCFVTASITLGVLKQDIHAGLLTDMVIFQYSLVALLCFGALVSTLCAVVAALRFSERP